MSDLRLTYLDLGEDSMFFANGEYALGWFDGEIVFPQYPSDEQIVKLDVDRLPEDWEDLSVNEMLRFLSPEEYQRLTGRERKYE